MARRMVRLVVGAVTLSLRASPPIPGVSPAHGVAWCVLDRRKDAVRRKLLRAYPWQIWIDDDGHQVPVHVQGQSIVAQIESAAQMAVETIDPPSTCSGGRLRASGT